MYEWGGDYINPAEVEMITKGKNAGSEYPYTMTVYMKGGRQLSKCYKIVADRNDAARQLSVIVNMYIQSDRPATLREVESIVNKAKEAIRRDIKKLREEMGNS